MIRYCRIPSPIGTLTAVSEDGYLIALHMLPTALPDDAAHCEDEPILISTEEWLARYFRGETPDVDIPMNPKGTAFQQSVWKLLCEIPCGESVTYGALAAKLGNPRMSAQAVGQAVSRNPIAILIPCHRVLGAGRKLTGYAGGLDRKRFLLDLEQIEYR